MPETDNTCGGYAYPLLGDVPAMARYIANSRTPYFNRHSFPLHFNVKVHGVDFSLRHLSGMDVWEHIEEKCRPGNSYHEDFMALAGQLITVREEELLQEAIEDAQNELDGDIDRMTCDTGEVFDVGFQFLGRSGGHLCIVGFEGHNLRGSSEDLLNNMLGGGTHEWVPDDAMQAEVLVCNDGHEILIAKLDSGGAIVQMDGTSEVIDGEELVQTVNKCLWRHCGDLGWPFSHIEGLYKLMRQWEVDFTAANVVDRVEQAAAYHLFVRICEPAWNAHREKQEKRKNIVQAVHDVHALLPQEASQAFGVIAHALEVELPTRLAA